MNKLNVGPLFIVVICFLIPFKNSAQSPKDGKKISTDLLGLFFEDINYAADGGLYAELVQNRSFEYNPTEQMNWNPYSFWQYISPGFSYGRISIETVSPVHPANVHYLVLDIEHVGHEAKYVGETGVGLKNLGFDGIVVRKGDKYNFSMFARQLSSIPVSIDISLQNSKGVLLAKESLSTQSGEWRKYSTTLTATASCDTANLFVLATSEGKLALDVISLFPEKTFKNRPNGLRADLARKLADMQPRFIRFPGGCLVHGDGLRNMYRWKNTIGPIEQRVEQRNLWGYHQSAGLGYFEFFQFCEDIGAKPLPVVPAAVSCQNSGGTWRIGGTGQKAMPNNEIAEYIQEIIDLIEWANGSTSTTWGAKRAAAGHPASFNLKYVGIGNEEKITPEFEERFSIIYKAVHEKHPEITIIGTTGPFHSGEDFDKGWKLANELNVPIVDEHYYEQPEWFLNNQKRYDSYKRNSTKVYLGEYASWGNKLKNAIAEAAYLTALERNGDVVHMASYAPMLAKKGFTQWTTDMIFFDNVNICLTPNYHVQKMFMTNQGDYYFDKVVTKDESNNLLAASCMQDSKTGDVIVKLVNVGTEAKTMKVDLSRFKKFDTNAEMTVLSGSADAENTFDNLQKVAPIQLVFTAKSKFDYEVPAMSLTVFRVKIKK